MTTPSFDVSTRLEGELPIPLGFRFAGVHAGIKRSRKDLGLIHCYAPQGAAAAGVYTRNLVRAPCVERNAALLPAAGVRAVLVNSGNANAMTGEAGVATNDALAAATAQALECAPAAVMTASTGVIGVPLDAGRITDALPELRGELGEDPRGFAAAILTTDTISKVAHGELALPGGTVRLFGVAKGSGMIHPNMATTLGFVCTDAAIEPALLQAALAETIETTFNAITVDGDTSTNDTVLVLASGESKVRVSADDEQALRPLTEALRAILLSLAEQVARDGEGATRLLEVSVEGAPSADIARSVARGCCRSSLFKCSVFAGERAGWGRLAAAAGQAALEAGVGELDLETIEIDAMGLPLVRGGVLVQDADPGVAGELTRRLREPTVRWRVSLGQGPGSFTALGCDFSYDYVRINSDEALQLAVNEKGQVGRQVSLSSYTPILKHRLLVDGLSYLRRFTGLRIIVQLSGSAARRPNLLAAVARDVELILDAELRVLVIVPDAEALAALRENMAEGAYRLAEATRDAHAIARRLDRGQACALVQATPDPGELVALCLRLGVGKLLCLADDQGLHDAGGLVRELTPEQALTGLDRGRFHTDADENLAIARHAARQGLPALHLIDGRLPHALVAELFTDQGVGTLITRQLR
ncbi:bifunctional glutamate N-acetyltransferase/amino-acid acetyltransferase ArgJ [Pseudenhygromyxa sp. WMMC2535]|uniref:bifunctional glutamate N-acetyltransferase/amino-acid acetyltransferase ArgJ n=1 Tax=Pseudenhygromyxa sp. WMMC2535 TaxID=2712867 RepID=UPI001552326D|nr:bifunctional glutamate N-acetyltransferase/amino-acid acetyltransferase ArgJ [Pseudenhygromyxa sp. WMMC2535]NVB36571.1 bifunctional glutamate N-acetyltransferase/amino-acid acetyltransferase ArgJ [Pseudenhygromyxa sp. WMMC2535]